MTDISNADVLAELQKMREDFSKVAASVELIRIAVIKISQRVGSLEESQLTPLPHLASVGSGIGRK